MRLGEFFPVLMHENREGRGGKQEASMVEAPSEGEEWGSARSLLENICCQIPPSYEAPMPQPHLVIATFPMPSEVF